MLYLRFPHMINKENIAFNFVIITLQPRSILRKIKSLSFSFLF